MSINVFEEDNIQKAILKLGVPAMLGQLATLIYNLADTYFVSLTNNPAQIAAVTLSAPILLLIMSISNICAMGGSSVIARLLGEKELQDAKGCLTFCLYAIFTASLIVLAAGMLFITPIARLAGADADNLSYTCDYLKWIFLAAPFIMLSNGFVHLFRSTGMVRQATMNMILGNCINIALDWLFIVRFQMGVSGAALATSIGFLCTTVYSLICILRASKNSELYSLSPLAIRSAEVPVGSIIAIGITGAMITVMLSISNIVLNNYLGIYGSDAVAAYGISYKIEMFPILLSVGLSQGVAPMIGYCFGNCQYARINKIMTYATIDGMVLGGIFTAVFLVLSKTLVSLFLHDESLIELSALFLRIMCLSAPMLGIINMVTSYYQALGKAFNSLLITLLRNIILFIPCVILLNFLFGLYGVIISFPIVETLQAIICIAMYLVSRRKIQLLFS